MVGHSRNDSVPMKDPKQSCGSPPLAGLGQLIFDPDVLGPHEAFVFRARQAFF